MFESAVPIQIFKSFKKRDNGPWGLAVGVLGSGVGDFVAALMWRITQGSINYTLDSCPYERFSAISPTTIMPTPILPTNSPMAPFCLLNQKGIQNAILRMRSYYKSSPNSSVCRYSCNMSPIVNALAKSLYLYLFVNRFLCIYLGLSSCWQMSNTVSACSYLKIPNIPGSRLLPHFIWQ